MEKILLGLLAFLIIKKIMGGKLEKIIKEKAEKDLEEAIKTVDLNKPTDIVSKNIERAVAKVCPIIYKDHRLKLQTGIAKIAASLKSKELAHVESDLQNKTQMERFFS